MCRRNQLLGCILLALGLGLLIGLWIDGGFLAHCCGFGFIIFGCSLAGKR